MDLKSPGQMLVPCMLKRETISGGKSGLDARGLVWVRHINVDCDLVDLVLRAYATEARYSKACIS